MLTLLFSTLGVGGALTAASIFIPGFLPAAISIIGIILRCKPCLIALAVVTAFIVGDVRGHRLSDAKCRAADIAMQLKAAQRDATIQADTLKQREQEIKDLAAESSGLKKQRDQYAELAKTGACPIGDDRARRLRDITR